VTLEIPDTPGSRPRHRVTAAQWRAQQLSALRAFGSHRLMSVAGSALCASSRFGVAMPPCGEESVSGLRSCFSV
jgi:hypothetical protein